MVVEASHAVAAGVAVIGSVRGPVDVAHLAVPKCTESAASHCQLIVDLAPHQLRVLSHVDGHAFHVTDVRLRLFLKQACECL